MRRDDIVKSFKILSDLLQSVDNECDKYDVFLSSFVRTMDKLNCSNTWFSEKNVRFAIIQMCSALNNDDIYALSETDFENDGKNVKKIALLTNDKAPFSNFIDLFFILLTGHVCVIKQFYSDDILLRALSEMLVSIDHRFSERIIFADTNLKDFDAIIYDENLKAASCYDHYLTKFPHVKKKMKKSVAVLRGDETVDELRRMAEDVFVYFGRHNTSVSKLYVPQHYDFGLLIDAFSDYEHLKTHARYYNNYEYRKAVCMINKVPFYDNGFMILCESEEMFAPISVVHYQEYFSYKDLEKKIENQAEHISAIVSKDAFFEKSIDFGQSNSFNFAMFSDYYNRFAKMLSVILN